LLKGEKELWNLKKKIQPIQSHIIEDGDGSLYRRNFEDGWEQSVLNV
jgi:hypothetical protein